MPSARSALSAGFAIVSLALLTDVADAPFDRALGIDAALFGIPIKRLLLVPTFLGSAWMLARTWPAARTFLRDAWPIAALVALAALSTLWSAAPAVTVSWSIGLAGTTALGAVLALRFTAEQELRIVALALALVLAAGALSAVVPVELGWRLWRREDGSLVGLFLDRNLFGRAAALCSLACGLAAVVSSSSRSALVCGAGAGAALWLLIGSRSVTPRLALLASVAVAGLLWSAPRLSPAARRRLLLGVALSTIAVALVLVRWPQWFALAVGRDATFSGRLTIWRIVIDAIGERPLLGYGYGGFWRSAAAQPLAQLAAHAHNGFLDLLAELGVVGGLLFALPAVVYGRAAVHRALAGRAPLTWWPPAYLTFLLVLNLAESALLRHKIFWALYVAAVVRVVRDPRV